MKCYVALLALLAVASGKSFYPGFPYTTGYNGVYPGSHVVNPYSTGFTGFTGFTGLPQQGFYNPIQQRVFKREAESDSDSFYPGYPFVPPYTNYGATPFSPYTASPFTPYYNPMVRPAVYNTYPHVYAPMRQTEQKQEVEVEQRQKRESDSDSFYPGYPFVPPYTNYGATPFSPYTASPFTPYYNPMVRPAVYNTYPQVYAPMRQTEQKQEVEVEQRQKRESDSDSFYPGYPFVAPYTSGYGMSPYNVAPYYSQPALPSVVPRVLPYNFPGYHYNTAPFVRTVANTQEQQEQ